MIKEILTTGVKIMDYQNELYERVKKRYCLGNKWPYWAIPSRLIEREKEIWLKEIKGE